MPRDFAHNRGDRPTQGEPQDGPIWSAPEPTAAPSVEHASELERPAALLQRLIQPARPPLHAADILKLQRLVGNRAVADLIDRASPRTPATPVGPEGGPVDDALAERISSQRGNGTALNPGLQSDMETGFGADFSSVRVHSGKESAALNQQLGARAFTTGSDIFLGSEVTQNDKGTLAHELTHVVQQRSTVTSGPLVVGPADDSTEHEADRIGKAVASGASGVARTEIGSQGVVARDDGGSRLPTPSAASAVPAQIKGMQSTFHERMREADEIIKGTEFHYNYVNGIYAENFKIHQVVVGQAHMEKLQSERIADAIIAAAALAAKFSPEGAAASVVVNIWQYAKKIEGYASKAGKVLTIAKAVVGGSAGGGEGGSAPMTPGELRIIGLEKVVSLFSAVTDVRDSGDAVLDAAVDLSTQIGMNAPDSSQLSAEQASALTETAAACEQLVADMEPLLTELRTLRDRRKVPVPSWREFEQDIWIAYFASESGIGTEQVLRNHMVDIGLWARLGIVEEHSMGMVWDTATAPAHEDQQTQQSVPAKTITGMDAIRGEAAALPAKWRRIMLLED